MSACHNDITKQIQTYLSHVKNTQPGPNFIVSLKGMNGSLKCQTDISPSLFSRLVSEQNTSLHKFVIPTDLALYKIFNNVIQLPHIILSTMNWPEGICYIPDFLLYHEVLYSDLKKELPSLNKKISLESNNLKIKCLSTLLLNRGLITEYNTPKLLFDPMNSGNNNADFNGEELCILYLGTKSLLILTLSNKIVTIPLIPGLLLIIPKEVRSKSVVSIAPKNSDRYIVPGIADQEWKRGDHLLILF